MSDKRARTALIYALLFAASIQAAHASHDPEWYLSLRGDRLIEAFENDLVTQKPSIRFLIELVRDAEGEEVLDEVSRYLWKREGDSPELMLLRDAAFRLDRKDRKKFLDKGAEFVEAEDKDGLREYLSEVSLIPMPEGHKLVRSSIGMGLNANVALLKDEKGDGQQVAWKVPLVATEERLNKLKKEEGIFEKLARRGVSVAEAQFGPKRRSLTKPYLDGPTVQDLGESFLTDFDDPRNVRLRAFFVDLIRKKIRVGDLNEGNIIDDKKRGWSAVDGNDYEEKGSEEAAFGYYEQDLPYRWHRDGFASQSAIKKFVSRIEADWQDCDGKLTPRS